MIGVPFSMVTVIIAFYAKVTHTDPVISGIYPNKGSINGATRITIHGSGFAANQFSLGADPDIGDRVDLVSGTRVFPCDIHIDGCTKIQITCNTRRMPEDSYFIHVYVDGVEAPTDTLCGGSNSYRCRFIAVIYQTPRITELSPSAGLPGEILQMEGKLFTDLYETNREEASNGQQSRILRVYLGGQMCELRVDGTDEYYGLGLYKNQYTDAYTDEGFLSCKPQGTYVGNQNFSFIVDQTYGRSLPELDVLRVTGQDKIAMYQTYAELIAVSPSIGSIHGGTVLTLNGHFFDQSDSPAQVTTAGVECSVESVTSDQILCRTGNSSEDLNIKHPGNRGLMMTTWNESSVDVGQLSSLSSLPTNDTNTTHLDQLYWTDPEPREAYLSLIQGYFVPPSDNLYKFYIKSGGQAELWLMTDGNSMNLVAESTISTEWYHAQQQQSDIFLMDKGKPYSLEVFQRDVSGSGHVQVAVHMYNTQYTAVQAGDVSNEIQSFIISSTIVLEQQRLVISAWTGQSGTAEIQQIELTSPSLSDVVFRLGLYGVYTAPLSGLASVSTLSDVLSDLPLPLSVDVSVVDTDTSKTITVTFLTDLGDWPDFEVLQDPTSDAAVTATVTQLTRGVSPMTHLILGFDGLPATPIDVSTITSDEIKASLDTLFTVRCPAQMSNPLGAVYDQQYERATSYPEDGSRISDRQPFCGSTASLNPTYLYRLGINEQEIDLFRNQYLCFAFRGSLVNTLRLNYNDSTDVWLNIDVQFPISDSWNYHCVDLVTHVREWASQLTSAVIKGAYISRLDTSDLLVDNVYIGFLQPNQDPDFGLYRRLVPRQWLARDVTVSDVVTGTYDVTINTYNCSYDLPLIDVQNAGVLGSGSVDLMTYSGATWPVGVQLQVSRLAAASPPVTGVYSLTFDQHTLNDIAADVLPEVLQDVMETIPDIGKLRVTRTGSCSGYKWNVEWMTSPGNHPVVEFDASGIFGDGVTMSAVTVKDGGVFFDPIPGDMLATAHSQPQVVVVINDIPSICSNDCGYSWDTAVTPVLSDVSPISGSVASGTELTISGSGFDTSVLSNNIITIGGVQCPVTGLSGSDLQCALGPGPAGTHRVLLDVLGVGLAGYSDVVLTFTYNFSVDTITPSSGGLGGGLLLTISGSGFGPLIGVTVGGSVCPIKQYGYLNITCILPPAFVDGVVDVVVFEGVAMVTSTEVFTYSSLRTPVIGSVTDTTALVSGGTVIDITGYNFTDDVHSVTLVDTPGTIVEYNDTFIRVQLHPNSVATFPLLILVEEGGYATFSNNSIPLIYYRLYVTSLSPSSGSLYGGAVLTISGSGYGVDPDLVDITIGGAQCIVTSSQSTEIECIAPSSARTHVVTNQGVHPDFGQGFSWLPQAITVQIGDTVRWQWTVPEQLSGIGYRVEQVSSPSGDNYTGSGLRSGTQKTANGVYDYQFSSLGQYFYWSGGAIDDTGMIVLRGVVSVEPKPDTIQMLSVKVSGYEAVYDDQGSSRRKKRGVTCTDVQSSCSDSDPALPGFGFWSCETPIVTSFQPTQGTANDVITVLGSGFGSLACQTAVTVGGYSCVPLTVSTSTITCLLDTDDAMAIGVVYDVIVDIINVGTALLQMADPEERRFVLMPHVTSVYPVGGSTSGGTTLTVLGGGFQPSLTSITIEGVPCEVTSVTYSQVTCVTGSAWSVSEADVEVSVLVYGQWVPSQCTTDLCVYTYSSLYTPQVYAITPRLITTVNQTLNITGSGFPVQSLNVSVAIGKTPCYVIAVSETEILCDTGYPEAGLQLVTVLVASLGYADMTINDVTVAPETLTLFPTTGSVAGGTDLTISGFGFSDDASVTVGGNPCPVQLQTSAVLICRTETAVVGPATVQVLSNTVNLPEMSYSFEDLIGITGLSPTVATSGESLVIDAISMVTDSTLVTVTVGGVECSMDTVTQTSVACVLGGHVAGEVSVTVHIQDFGFASGDLAFTYGLRIQDIDRNTGSHGGGQSVLVSGYGFGTDLIVTICGQPCPLTSVNTTEALCLTPPNTVAGDTSCDVTVSLNELSDTAPGAYTYLDSLTPTISGVTPRRGGTGGGTLITITGSNFGVDISEVTVTVADTVCLTQTVTDTDIVCRTQEHRPSVQTEAVVQIATDGIAKSASSDAAFQYIDVWSSPFTWGGLAPPTDGDLVVIPADMTVLLDTDTPVLKLILIQGGKVIFDEIDVELQSEIILITDGGLLQVGTESEPFQHRATITLHGHVKSKELPVYGTKCIAVREGRLELHGKPSGMTWTHLSATASPGDTTISLVSAVLWSAGDQIIIASTGLRHSQAENEQKTIVSVSEDSMTLTLDSALAYQHLGEQITLTDDRVLEARAEVGLLSHNIVIRGNDNPQWHDVIEACADGFDTGEFATQTCFQGRFGEEIGSDQFGAHVIMHAAESDAELVIGRLENVELTHVGQAFRLGRYPVHFHLNGAMPSSYVRSCSVHRSFNRAVNIHGTRLVTVEQNVVYDIMGGAFFLEDGVETGNVFQYNLAVFVHSSTSLQNDDVTPAAFWVTNPNNTVRHNAVAGGTHFGFWYRMHEHPDGPSYDPNVCPRAVPLGSFDNNTVHSQGWFGIWIFQHYYPVEGGSCLSDVPVPAAFYRLTAWNNEKGAEWVGGGALQFVDFLLVHNEVAGLEMKLVANIDSVQYGDDGPMVRDSLIVAEAGPLSESPTAVGIILPYGRGMSIRGSTFVAFGDRTKGCLGVTTIAGSTENYNGGYTYHTTGLTFVDSGQHKVHFRWQHEAVFRDLDGSLCGSVGCQVVPWNPSLPPACIEQDSGYTGAVSAAVCDSSVKLHRFSFNDASPSSLPFKNVTFSSEHGTTYSPFTVKRVTHPKGWMVVLPSHQTYIMTWENAEQITNISYTGTFYNLLDDDYLLIIHNFTQRPDFVHVLEGDSRNSTDALTPESMNGDWILNDQETTLSYIISAKTPDNPSGSMVSADTKVNLDVFRCYFDGCAPPVDPNTLPPFDTRPDHATFWHDPESWNGTEEGWGGHYGNDTYGIPLEGDNVRIPADRWIVIRESTPVLGQVWLYGGLEFEFSEDNLGQYYDFVFTATHIVIIGGRLVAGWPNKPFHGTLDLILTGNHLSPDLVMSASLTLGAKAIGVFGGLDLHGTPRDVSWTRLSQTADIGVNSLIVETAVDWHQGDQIIIVPTGLDLVEAEIRTITEKSSDNTTLTWALDQPLQFRHQVTDVDLDGSTTYRQSAEVGLLSRNIRVIGADYPQLEQQAFGVRVLVGTFASEDSVYLGYARLSDVEFYHSGQEGWTDWYDPRYSLAFLNLGDVTPLKPSYVTSCAFHHGFSPAIGVYGTNKLEMSDNVIHHTVGSALIVTGVRNIIRHNMVTYILHPGVFNGRNEERPEWDAGIEAVGATEILIQDNSVSGSQRALYHVDGEPCSRLTDPDLPAWSGNTGHSSLSGLIVMPGDGFYPCTLLSDFIIYRTHDFGIYVQTNFSFIIQNYISIDNQLGLFPMAYNPSSLAHQYANKLIQIEHSVFVGRSAALSCTEPPLTGINMDLSGNGRSWSAPRSGMVAISWPTFSSGSNKAPFKPFIGIMSYQALYGLLRVTNVTFSGYNSACNGAMNDVVMTTNPSNDDVQHPVEMANITLYDVSTDNLIYIHRSSLGRINPSDCVDMECDAMKKALLRDTDGSFLGEPAALFSESEWAWDKDPARGLGDYRIPTTFLTDSQGNRIDVDSILVGRGIVRDDTCRYQSTYQAYICANKDYHMLHMESMDSDTETRRVSPVSIYSEGYIDLVNGPQDHGWCMGYTCQLRLSTFPFILASGKSYEIYFTGTTPQAMRYHWLNTDQSEAVVLVTWFAQSWRLNVYVDELYVEPTNAYYTAAGQLATTAPTSEGQFRPQLGSDPTGTNYFDRQNQQLYVLVRGSQPVDVVTDQTILVTFNMPYMTVDEFFGEKIVDNLAAFFDLPPSKIRYAEAVSAARRRRRSEEYFSFTVEIANAPALQLNATAVDGQLSAEAIRALSSAIINSFQLGELSAVLNITIASMSVIEPPPVPGTDEWQLYTELGQVGAVSLAVPEQLVLAVVPEAATEGNAFTVQPTLQMTDIMDIPVEQVGAFLNPWHVAVTMEMTSLSDVRAVLSGTDDVTFSGRWANFTDLVISHSGTYRLIFNVSSPPGGSIFENVTSDVIVPQRNLFGQFASQPDYVTVGEVFNVSVQLIETETNLVIEDISWKGHNWTCEPFLYKPLIYPGSLVGVHSGSLDSVSGLGTFNDLYLTSESQYVLSVQCVSVPAAYNFTFPSEAITVYDNSRDTSVQPQTKTVQLRFYGNYASVAAGEEAYLAAAVSNHLWLRYNTVLFSGLNITSGSIVATFYISGSVADVATTLNDLWQYLKQPMTVVYGTVDLTAMLIMTVDGVDFYGSDSLFDSWSDLSDGAIVGISLAVIAIVAAVVGALIWIFWIKEKPCPELPTRMKTATRRQRVQDDRRHIHVDSSTTVSSVPSSASSVRSVGIGDPSKIQITSRPPRRTTLPLDHSLLQAQRHELSSLDVESVTGILDPLELYGTPKDPDTGSLQVIPVLPALRSTRQPLPDLTRGRATLPDIRSDDLGKPRHKLPPI